MGNFQIYFYCLFSFSNFELDGQNLKGPGKLYFIYDCPDKVPTYEGGGKTF
jgi:hypothetical protein